MNYESAKPDEEKNGGEHEEDIIFEDESAEEVFQRYVYDLRLTEEDLKKKILDVGSYDSSFAKHAKELGINGIYSLEPLCWEKSRDRSGTIAGFIEDAPFRDKSFDLVVSLCAIPNMFSTDADREEKLRKSISEMARIIKDDGEIRLGRVIKKGPHEFQNKFKKLLDETLSKIAEEKNLSVEEIDLPTEPDTYEYDEIGHLIPVGDYEDVLIKIKRKK